MSARVLLLVFAFALAAGCGGKAPAVAAPVASAPPQARLLCLAEHPGTGRLESALAARQREAAAGAAQAARWIAVGREWVRVARLTADPGFYLNVDACADEALALEPGHPPALELRALRLLSDHRFEEARALAQDIVVRDPESGLGYGTLSDALLELGRYDESAAAAQQLARVHPGTAASSRGAYLAWLEGDTRRAKVLMRDALIGRDGSDPEPDSWVLAEAATLYWNEGDRDGADALYAQALRWLPTQGAALLGRARIALARSDADAALAFLDAADRARPSVESAWLRGDALTLRGDEAAAARAYDEAVRLGRRGDRLNLALFLATRNRDVAEALAAVDDEAESRAGVYVDDVRAFALYRAGRIDEALAASERVLAVGTRDARLLFHAGAIRIAAGDATGGRKLVARALELNPDFDASGAREARALLDGSHSTAVATR